MPAKSFFLLFSLKNRPPCVPRPEKNADQHIIWLLLSDCNSSLFLLRRPPSSPRITYPPHPPPLWYGHTTKFFPKHKMSLTFVFCIPLTRPASIPTDVLPFPPKQRFTAVFHDPRDASAATSPPLFRLNAFSEHDQSGFPERYPCPCLFGSFRKPGSNLNTQPLPSGPLLSVELWW